MSLTATFAFLFGIFLLAFANNDLQNRFSYLLRDDHAIYMTGFSFFLATVGWRSVYMRYMKKK